MKRILPLLLILALALSGCGPAVSDPTGTPAPSPDSAPSSAPTPTPTLPTPTPTPGGETGSPEQPEDPVRLAVLSGPTGVGAAKLMADNDAGESTLRYDVSVVTDNSMITAGLINGEYDIAAIATNVASNLYWKSEGGVQLAAINTLGVLYLLGRDGVGVGAVADLRGHTVYATGQGANPEYVLRYLLRQNGLDPDTDVDIVWQAAEEVTATMLQGKGDICMLPVPAATALTVKSEGAVHELLSLSDQWDELRNGSQLTMGCVVVRTAYAQAYPETVARFLEEYADSIAYVREHPAEMAQTVTDYGITPSAPIAQKAIPKCNLVCITGDDMRDAIQGYYQVLYEADPNSIGGGVPDDAFYFLGLDG